MARRTRREDPAILPRQGMIRPDQTARHLVLLPLCGLFLAGCDTLDLAGFATPREPAVTAIPVKPPPAPGMERSGETFAGKVSWYSVRTNGGTKTASGERFADHGETAAHRSLPFGTLVEVTNLANERSIVLRINDRGPFKKDRVLDVSIGAARKLGFDKQGLASCHVEVLRPAPAEEPEAEEQDEIRAPEAAAPTATLATAETPGGSEAEGGE